MNTDYVKKFKKKSVRSVFICVQYETFKQKCRVARLLITVFIIGGVRSS
jgi:hypothetical protein